MAGLPWIKVWTVVGNHPKVQRLEKEMGVDDALGMVIRLWCWTADYHPDGDVPEADAGAMVAAVLLNRKGDKSADFVTRACVTAGLLDRIDGGFRVHDWADMQTAHLDSAEKKKEQARERQRKYRAKASVTSKRDVTRDVTRDSVTKREREIESRSEQQQQRGGLPLRDEVRFAQWPLAAALRQRLAEEWPGLGWTKQPDADNAAVARCGLDACASACLAHGRASKVAPEALGFFSGLLADLQPRPSAAPESLAWRRVLDAHEALPPGDQWPGIRELNGRTDGEALVVEAHSQQRADALVAIGRREWLAKLAGCPVRIEAAGA